METKDRLNEALKVVSAAREFRQTVTRLSSPDSRNVRRTQDRLYEAVRYLIYLIINAPSRLSQPARYINLPRE